MSTVSRLTNDLTEMYWRVHEKAASCARLQYRGHTLRELTEARRELEQDDLSTMLARERAWQEGQLDVLDKLIQAKTPKAEETT